jgi:hypothetical protein
MVLLHWHCSICAVAVKAREETHTRRVILTLTTHSSADFGWRPRRVHLEELGAVGSNRSEDVVIGWQRERERERDWYILEARCPPRPIPSYVAS